jgi:hypothetical protein
MEAPPHSYEEKPLCAAGFYPGITVYLPFSKEMLERDAPAADWTWRRVLETN